MGLLLMHPMRLRSFYDASSVIFFACPGRAACYDCGNARAEAFEKKVGAYEGSRKDDCEGYQRQRKRFVAYVRHMLCVEVGKVGPEGMMQ